MAVELQRASVFAAYWPNIAKSALVEERECPLS
jgi:hypothetical protein